ncbi:YqzH family protein [Heyndrickxia acidicola]|uniref:YqzH family protein n=1 Tax=Heyndrickxia acidicola TaxID=209389 RepID=A0ABU6MKQ6_9BACI|nr:YqzH family protein [Heyndrickxia acidicola]MED1205255.1 YqzH family protein [Heyndrickxia acidicola]
MQTQFTVKMIRKCFEQYQYEFEVPPLSKEEYETLSKRALASLQEDPDTSN